MKAISLTQPFATLMAIKAKRYETRSWSTSYRGPLLIHATATWDSSILDELDPLVTDWLEANGYFEPDAFPTSQFVAVGLLQQCVPTISVSIDELEEACGNFTPGRYAWLVTPMHELDPGMNPTKVRGRLGLWEPTAEQIQRVVGINGDKLLTFETAGS